jgi:flagellar biosynthesis protein FlhG
MSDSADFRRLVFRAAQSSGAEHSGARILVISGGRMDVGATTLTVNVAALLAQEALRVVLVDADLTRADAAAQCGLAGKLTLHDVLAGRRSVHEALQLGPAGLQLIPGSALPETRAAVNERSISRMLRQLRSLTPHADWLIIDAGHQPSELMARLWGEADTVLLVTSPDAVAVMDTYALIKTLLTRSSLSRPPALVINKLQEPDSAADVHRRIDQSCRRFLGLAVEFAAAVPADPGALVSSGSSGSSSLAAQQSRLHASIRQLMSHLTEPPPEPAIHRRAA